MLEIRSFQNADLPSLADIWCIHHALYRRPPAVSQAVFEQAVASRLFFEPARLLVATIGKETVAWAHWFPGDDKVASLTALCFRPELQTAAAVSQLLSQVESDAFDLGMLEISVGVHCQSMWGYQGMEPIGHGFGVDVADDRTNTLLEAAGYQETKRIDHWEAQTAGYRAPVNRDLLMLRRSTRIRSEVVTSTSVQTAAAMIHFDIERYLLVDTRTNAPLASLDLWTSDPETLVMQVSDAILGSWSVPGLSTLEPYNDLALRYLLTSVISELAERRIRTVQRSVETDNIAEASTLIAANFSRTSVGRLMSKTFIT